jgi:hypothetical protein
VFNVSVGEILVALALLGLVVGGVYRLIGLAVRRELRKREGT